MSIAAFILARKGSKRLPGKNTKLLCGKPLIEYTIDAVIESGVIDTLVVGTDDEAVKEICREKYDFYDYSCYDYEDLLDQELKRYVIHLPSYLTTDNAPQTEALLYCMDQIEKHDIVLLLQPTSPLRASEDIKEFCNGKYDYSVSGNSKFEDGSNGAMYIDVWDNYYNNRTFFLHNKYYMPLERSIDIDTEEDFKKAEMLMKERLN